MQIITSNQNSLIKELKSLKLKRLREEKGLFFIEGMRFVGEAIEAKADIDKIFVSDKLTDSNEGSQLIKTIENRYYNIFSIPQKIFNEISDTETPQGILATIKIKHKTEVEISDKDNFFILLDALQDPGNMGTIIRTADAAGVSGIIISKGCVDIYNPKVLRSTMGSIFHTPVYFSDDLSNPIDKLKQNGIKVLAAHLKGKADYFDVDMTKRCAIIIGNEANGINNDIANKADLLVKIPMIGSAESLNASVAASLMMYEVVRQRRNK